MIEKWLVNCNYRPRTNETGLKKKKEQALKALKRRTVEFEFFFVDKKLQSLFSTLWLVYLPERLSENLVLQLAITTQKLVIVIAWADITANNRSLLVFIDRVLKIYAIDYRGNVFLMQVQATERSGILFSKIWCKTRLLAWFSQHNVCQNLQMLISCILIGI